MGRRSRSVIVVGIAALALQVVPVGPAAPTSPPAPEECARGYVLDGWGGIHPFHSPYSPAPPPITVGAYTPGRDVWVQLVAAPDGSASGRMTARAATAGYHAAGVTPPAFRAPEAVPPEVRRWYFSNPATPTDTSARLYGSGFWQLVVDGSTSFTDILWFERDLARAWNRGLLLDAFGGLHPSAVPGISRAGPASTSGGPYWPGWDIARGIAVLPGNAGGYVLDGWGGLHPFSVAGRPAPPAVTSGPYWSGWDIARDVVLLPCAA
jgi:hypothetical protein